VLFRSSRNEGLQALLEAIELQGIGREQIGFPAAAAAFRQGDPEQARRILQVEGPEIDPLRWHWLMARIADSLGEADLAFAEAVAMNRSEIETDRWLGRGKRHLEFIRGLADTVTSEWASGLETLGSDGRRTPAFLVGFPRSGTTLMDTFLMGHPDTAVLEEIPLVNAAQKFLGEFAALPARSPEELDKARDAYFEALGQHVDPAFRGLVVDKLPLNMLAVPYLYSMFPEARFVFAQRHPCDAVLSCFMQAFSMNDSMACFLDLDTAANFYDAAMRLWMRSRETIPINVHTLVYEELIVDPEAALRPLIDFLELEWSDELLDHRATAKARSAIGTPSYNQVTQQLMRSPTGRWKRYEKQLAPVLPTLLPWADRLGYGNN